MKNCEAAVAGAVLSVIFLLSGTELPAQDIIYPKNGDPIEAKVREIGETYVIYRTWDNPDGPDYRLSAASIFKIRFNNGTEKRFDGSGDRLEDLMMSGAVVPGGLYYKRGRYFIRGSIISSEDLIDYIGYTTYGSTYLKAKRQYTSGLFLTMLGAGLVTVGAIAHIAYIQSRDFFDDSSSMMPSGMSLKHDNSDMYLCIACYAAGAGSLAAGIPLLVSGNKKLGAIADDYNRRYGYVPGRTESSLTFGNCRNGLGLAFNF